MNTSRKKLPVKRLLPVIAAAFLGACGAAPEAPSPSAVPAASVTPSAAKRASATGVVQSIDTAAQTLTISHDPVQALGWPAMTMTFQARGVDLSTIKSGDKVAFEFTSSGMDGSIVSIRRASD